MKLRKHSLENDYNHEGYFVLYTWRGFWDLPDEYNDDEWFNEEENEPKFFLNDCYVDNCKGPIDEFISYILQDNRTQYHNHTAELWFVEKSMNKITAYRVAAYCSNILTEEAVIKDAIEYNNEHPSYGL